MSDTPLARQNKILMVYIEPTPYIIGLIEALIAISACDVDILFLNENLSQKWDINLKAQWLKLPSAFIDRLKLLAQLFLKQRYSMIHLAGWGEPWCLLILFLAKITKIPVAIESDTPRFAKMKYWKRFSKRMVYPLLFRLVDLFLPGGIRQAKYIEEYWVHPNRIIPVQMTVDVSGIRSYVKNLSFHDRAAIRLRYNIPINNLVYIFVGRLEIYKGINELLSSFGQTTHENITLLIVGDGGMVPVILNAMQKNNKIRYVGRLAANDLIEAYYAADVLVLPAHFEPWGLVVNEAMAIGLPVIVSDTVGCIDDLVAHMETGMIIPAESHTELKNAVEYLYDHPETRMKMAINAHNKIADWTLENEAKKICQAWNKLVYSR